MRAYNRRAIPMFQFPENIFEAKGLYPSCPSSLVAPFDKGQMGNPSATLRCLAQPSWRPRQDTSIAWEFSMKALTWHGKGDIRCERVADPGSRTIATRSSG